MNFTILKAKSKADSVGIRYLCSMHNTFNISSVFNTYRNKVYSGYLSNTIYRGIKDMIGDKLDEEEDHSSLMQISSMRPRHMLKLIGVAYLWKK